MKLLELAAGVLASRFTPAGSNILPGTQMDQAGQFIDPGEIGQAAQMINQLASELQQPGAM